NAIEPCDELRDGGRVFFDQLEARFMQLGAYDEELHGRGARELLDAGGTLRNGKRQYRKRLFARNTQRLPARRNDPNVRRRFEERIGKTRAFVDHMLAVV